MTETKSILPHFPISMFAITMGLSGLTLATENMRWITRGDDLTFWLLAHLTLGVYGATLVTYLLKFIKYPSCVLAEWRHPLKINFFPAASISLLLLGAAFYSINETISFYLWAVGTVCQFVLSMSVINSWINHPQYRVCHMTPTWFIPAVGNIIVPIIGFEHAPSDVSWFFFAWGFLFWIILLTLIINRLVFHEALASKLLPTLFIFLAPPSVGFISYTTLVGELDIFARLIYYCAGLFFLIAIWQIHRLVRLKFSITCWAYAFPMAAFTNATYTMGDYTAYTFFVHGARGLFVITAILIGFLFIRTLIAIKRNELFHPDE